MFAGFGFAQNSRRPNAGEGVFVAIIPESDCRDQHGERREQRRPGFLAHHLAGDDENVARQFCKAAGFAGGAAEARAEPSEEFFFIARAGNFRVSRAGGGQGMSIAAADADLAPVLGELRGLLIRALQHMAIANLDGRKIFLEPGEVFELTAAGDAGENVVNAEEKPAFGEVHEQRDKIAAPLLQLQVLPLAHVVNADVHFGAARHFASEFFADEKIGMPAQLFGAFDGIVIGESEELHAAALQECVNFLRIAITFAANLSDNRSRTRSGEVRVNMQVAFHVSKNKRRKLQAYDTRAKFLKMQIFNSFDTVTEF